nr:hypothetical protein [Tanacetum cinerariifolium]
VFLPESHVDGVPQQEVRPLPSQDIPIGGSSLPEREILTGQNVEEGESSCGATAYVLGWAIPRRCRVDTPEWC